ncbi:MAG: NUDIX hydrolase [Bacteroidota bacterium]
MNFCSHCGSSQLIMTVPAGDNRPRQVCMNCHTIHYSNPKMVVGCLPVFEDRILLCKRAIEPRSGYWNLPAGYLENGETVQDGAKRETLEEAGVEVEIVRMHCVYNIPRINQVYLFFLAQMSSPQWEAGEETLEIGLYKPEDIPFAEMAFPSSTFAIKQYLAHQHEDFQGVHMGGWQG